MDSAKPVARTSLSSRPLYRPGPAVSGAAGASAGARNFNGNFRPNVVVKTEESRTPIAVGPIISNVFVHVKPSSHNNRTLHAPPDIEPQTAASHYGILKFNRHNQVNFHRWSSQHATVNRDIDVRSAAAIQEPAVTDANAGADDEQGDGGSEYKKFDREKFKKRRWELSRNRKRVSLQQKVDQAPMIVNLKQSGDIKHEIKQEPNSKPIEKLQARRRRFRGTREPDALNSAYYVFSRTAHGDWEAFPIEHIFAFKPYQRSALNDDVAEEMFKRRDKVFNTFAHFATQRIAAAQSEEAENADTAALSALRITSVKDRPKTGAGGGDDDTSTKVASSREKRRKARRGSDDEESDDGDDEGREVDYITDSDPDSPGRPGSPLGGEQSGDPHDEMVQMRGLDEELAEDEADEQSTEDEEDKHEKADDNKNGSKHADADNKQADGTQSKQQRAGASSVGDNNSNGKKRRRPAGDDDEDENDDTMDDDDVEVDRPKRSDATAMIVGRMPSSDVVVVDDDDDLDKFSSPVLDGSRSSTAADASIVDGMSSLSTGPGSNAVAAPAGQNAVSAPQASSFSSEDEKFMRNLLKKPLHMPQILEKFSKYRAKINRPLTAEQVGRHVMELKRKLNVQQLDVGGGKPKFFISHT